MRQANLVNLGLVALSVPFQALRAFKQHLKPPYISINYVDLSGEVSDVPVLPKSWNCCSFI